VRAIQDLASRQELGTTQRYMHLSSVAIEGERFDCSIRANPSLALETSLTTSAVSRNTFSVQAAGAGSHKPRVGGGSRVAGGERFPECPSLSARNISQHQMAVLPTKHLFGHDGP
jgi:hypothetical protein